MRQFLQLKISNNMADFKKSVEIISDTTVLWKKYLTPVHLFKRLISQSERYLISGTTEDLNL